MHAIFDECKTTTRQCDRNITEIENRAYCHSVPRSLINHDNIEKLANYSSQYLIDNLWTQLLSYIKNTYGL